MCIFIYMYMNILPTPLWILGVNCRTGKAASSAYQMFKPAPPARTVKDTHAWLVYLRPPKGGGEQEGHSRVGRNSASPLPHRQARRKLLERGLHAPKRYPTTHEIQSQDRATSQRPPPSPAPRNADKSQIQTDPTSYPSSDTTRGSKSRPNGNPSVGR